MITQTVRRQFLDYFKQKKHAIIASSSVVPHDDPTLLFINAGMNQFKDVFLGKSVRDYARAATSQKCIRVGGKHNDLENVGHTRRHLTFFEMLGNFSFGDYFKAEAIQYAWEVSVNVFGFDPSRIWPSVFREDDEAFELWTRYVPAERITRFDEKDNFWAMGETGPCGPCSELLYDRGSKYGDATTPKKDLSGERFLEFWNLVFMQYNRSADGTLEPLPKPSIDTGAGLERVMSLKMDVDSVFETDILRSLISQIEALSGIAYDLNDHERSPAFRVIADHLRCLCFAIADGVQPSNVDRGYVLRKVLRRAVRYGRSLGMEKPFLAQLLPRLIEVMGDDYHELKKGHNRIAEILTTEEEAFIRTLRRGGNILNQIIEHAHSHHKKISGEEAFKLKDTYGFPIEEILLLAKDADLSVDLKHYQILEQEAKEKSRTAQKVTQELASESLFADFVKKHGPSEFLGYTQQATSSKVIALVVNGAFTPEMKEEEEGIVILDKTPFYAEMGGQVGDIGSLESPHQSFNVSDCQSPFKGIIAHHGILTKGNLKIGDTITASIDVVRRQKIQNNHTATHLLHWALHSVLGDHVKQAGSVVDPDRLRFDFSHHKPLTQEEIRKIEDLVNQKIRANTPVKWYEIDYEAAQKQQEIKQFFGEKYGTKVRVIDIDYSKELCGGTHTNLLGNIGLFRIARESSIAAGMRRIEAVTGDAAEALYRQNEDLLNQLASQLKIHSSKLSERVGSLLEENKAMEQELKLFRKKQLEELTQSLLSQIETIDHISFLAKELSLTPEELRSCSDGVMTKASSLVLILATVIASDKCHLIIKVSDDLVKKGIHANDLMKALAPLIEGTGGGKSNQAQGGGKAPHKLKEAFLQAQLLIRR